MAYSDFTFEQLETQLGLRFDEQPLFDGVALAEPSPWLLKSLALAQRFGFVGEKSRSERLISPVLLDVAVRYSDLVTVQSGILLTVDPQIGLNGECDFVLSYGRIREFLTTPIFCVAEAKRQDMELGIVQGAAQLVGAWRHNQRRQATLSFLYGCATTGTEWRFMRLEGNLLTLDANRYFLTDLSKLLGVLQSIVEEGRPYAPAM